jgi:hypothetical protein
VTKVDQFTELKKQNILYRWELKVEELTTIVDTNPSLRGFMLGYVAEYKLRKLYFDNKKVSEVSKDDDHDREHKGDIKFKYGLRSYRVECKSLQTNTVKHVDGKFSATYQCDASDSRELAFSDGSKTKTTCLRVGEFDIVAVNLFAFFESWRFAFALNKDLPRSTFKKYSILQQSELLSSSMPITWPLQAPYVDDPFLLLDRLAGGS